MPSHFVLQNLGIQRGGRWLFRGLDWEVPRGRFVAVVGPSGVGKTSLLACLANHIVPDEGTLEAPVAAQVGFIYQDLELSPHSTVLENVLCGRLGRYPWWKTLWRFPAADRQAAYAWLYDFGIAPLAFRRLEDLSGGEQQRAGLARALLQEPSVILADEPVSNLDNYYAGRVLGTLRQQAHQHDRTVVCVLHQPDLVERFADHVLSFDPQNPRGWQIRTINR